MNRSARNLLGAITLLVTLAGASSFSFGAPVTDFGGDRNRRHFSDEPWGYPMCAAWAVDLGRSASQPLIVGERIYHLAGDGLWALRKTENLPKGISNESAKQLLVVWHKGGLQQSISHSHPTYVDTTVRSEAGITYRGVIYAGTGVVPGVGSPSLVAVAAQDGTLLGRLFLSADIVTAPLVFGDVVVFGTTDGKVWSVRGLTKQGDLEVKVVELSGRVTSSPVPLGTSAFLIGSDGADNQGAVMAYDLNLKRLWEEPVITPTGVAASFAKVDENNVYFSDKSGVFYSLNTNTRRFNWINTLGGGFVNNSPAVDSRYVYFTVRNVNGGPGRLISFDRSSGNFAWDATLPAHGNTAPLIWADAGAILVGDTSGRITAWRAPQAGEPQDEGQPVPFATQLSCHDAGHLRTFWQRVGGTGRELLQHQLILTESPFRDGIGWSQASGAGTEPGGVSLDHNATWRRIGRETH